MVLLRRRYSPGLNITSATQTKFLRMVYMSFNSGKMGDKISWKTNLLTVTSLGVELEFALCSYSQSRGTKTPCWRAKVALGQEKQKAHIILNGNILCLSCPSATFAFQLGDFVPRRMASCKRPIALWSIKRQCYKPVVFNVKHQGGHMVASSTSR